MSIFTNEGKTKLNAYLCFEVLKCSAFAAVLAELLVEQLATRVLGGATVSLLPATHQTVTAAPPTCQQVLRRHQNSPLNPFPVHSEAKNW